MIAFGDTFDSAAGKKLQTDLKSSEYVPKTGIMRAIAADQNAVEVNAVQAAGPSVIMVS